MFSKSWVSLAKFPVCSSLYSRAEIQVVYMVGSLWMSNPRCNTRRWEAGSIQEFHTPSNNPDGDHYWMLRPRPQLRIWWCKTLTSMFQTCMANISCGSSRVWGQTFLPPIWADRILSVSLKMISSTLGLILLHTYTVPCNSCNMKIGASLKNTLKKKIPCKKHPVIVTI